MSWVESSFRSKFSPLVLCFTVLLALVLFVVALVHLLLRYLSNQRSANSRNYPPASTSGAVFQRQLQQLFHLQDSGLDQAHIESLPVFPYEDIITGSMEPFDCAVCLCEFTEQDRLRLLPWCCHAFHVACIDTWLLSNSSCPLCRGVISSSGFSFENPFSFSEDSSKEGNEDGGVTGNSGLVIGDDDGLDSAINGRRVFSVRLGKFRNINSNSNNHNDNSNNSGENQESEVGGSSNFHGGGELNARRCFSMGSFQYVVTDLDLQVALCPSGRGRGEGHNENFTFDGANGGGEVEEKKIYSGDKGESFSVSKIWLWSKKDKVPGLP